MELSFLTHLRWFHASVEQLHKVFSMVRYSFVVEPENLETFQNDRHTKPVD